jgi:AcrR family transcriptional regulator
MKARDGPVRRGLAIREVHRARILDAVVEVVAERGCSGASVRLATARAGVSSRTFYENFTGLEECLVAVLDGALERATPIVVCAFSEEEVWSDGMRAALAAMLELFESEPELARVCIVETLAGGSHVREHRERVMERFRALVVARIESEVSHASPLAPEGTMASVLGVVYARLAAHEPEPLLGLLGPLMGVIVGPFMSTGEVAHEIEKGDALAQKMLSTRVRSSGPGRVCTEVPAALRDPRAHRARLCLSYVVAESRRGSHPSNREVGEAIGVVHRPQVSALLALLSDLGLLSKRQGGPGRPNAWSATPKGIAVVHMFGDGV